MNRVLSEKLEIAHCEAIVREMAEHIVAGVYGGLNTANDCDVIAYLYDAPQRYHHQLILDHIEEAGMRARAILDELSDHQKP